MITQLRVIGVGVLLFTLASAAHAENWPQWRGPNHDGVSHEKDIPTEWGADKNIVWKLDLPGVGCSTPAIRDERVFVTTEDGADVVLICVSTNGEQLWKRKVGSGGRRARGDEGNAATSSPCTDGKNVWAFAGSGELACFDFDGKQVWSFNVQERYGRFVIQFGMHSTPTLYGDRLYMQTLHTAGQWVFAVDKSTGKEVWKINRQADTPQNWESPHGYASTTLWKKGDDAYLIVHGNDYTTAHRLADGAEIWRIGDLNPGSSRAWRFVSSPGVSEELIVIPTCKNGPTVAIRPDITGTVGAGGNGEMWRLKVTTDVPTPLIHGGLVFICRADGQLLCLDAKTGKEQYSERGYNSRHRASPIYADGKIYVTARDGTFQVLQAGTEFKLLAKNKLPDDFAATPAISNGRIYLHGFKSLYAIGTK